MLPILYYIIVGYSFCLAVKIAIVVSAICVLWFVCELAYYEINGLWWRNFRRQQQRVVDESTSWKVVAQLAPSDQFSRRAFYPVIVCDWDPIDDPLYPQVSLLHAVEIRKRNSFWHTITVWRVSLMTGRQTHVCEFHYFDATIKCGLDQFDVFALQSRGVIVVQFKDRSIDSSTFFVYDTRFDVKMSCTFDHYAPSHLLAIACLNRRRNDESIDGWRIRMVDLRRQRYRSKAAWAMGNTVYDLDARNGKVALVRREEMIFLRRNVRLTTMRSRRKFGCYVEHDKGKTFVYDSETNAVEVYESLSQFVDSDDGAPMREMMRRLGAYSTIRCDCVQVMTDQESIITDHRNLVWRDYVAVPTLRMLAARTLFEKYPTTMSEMNEIEFRNATGVDMRGHFD